MGRPMPDAVPMRQLPGDCFPCGAAVFIYNIENFHICSLSLQ